MRNVLTVDVEEYFQVSAFEGVVSPSRWETCESRVEASVDRLLACLDEHGVRATCFVVGWVAERHPGMVRRLAAAGHEVACHSYAHRRIGTQTAAEFREDLHRAKAAIEDACGRPVTGYRAPSFSIVRSTLWALDALVEAGFEYDSSVFPIRHDRYGIPGAPRHPYRISAPGGGSLWELPPATVRWLGAAIPVAGGGYLRHLPPRVMHWGIRRLNVVDRLPAVVYLHPWELDPGQPRHPVGLLTGWRHYGNLAGTEARLRGLLRSFDFQPACSLVQELEREAVPAPSKGQAEQAGAVQVS